MLTAPQLPPPLADLPVQKRLALLINPFYPKDPRASFGKHVLTPSLALTSIVMGYYNTIVAVFESEAGQFEPSFYERQVSGKTIVIVDEWCTGFLKGIRLDAAAWKPLKRERPELLKPLELFGTRAGWRELKAGGDARMHATWSPRIAPAVREIHTFWLAHRRGVRASAGRREH
jgi:Uncharacterised protein family (UPF0149)